MKHYVAEVNITVDFIEKHQVLQEFVESNYGSISTSENEGDYE